MPAVRHPCGTGGVSATGDSVVCRVRIPEESFSAAVAERFRRRAHRPEERVALAELAQCKQDDCAAEIARTAGRGRPPSALLAKGLKKRGESSARVLDRLADQREEEGLDDEADEIRFKAHSAREEAASKAVAKSGGSLVRLSGVGMVVFVTSLNG